MKTSAVFMVDKKEPSYGNGRKEGMLEKKEWGKENERLSERETD